MRIWFPDAVILISVVCQMAVEANRSKRPPTNVRIRGPLTLSIEQIRPEHDRTGLTMRLVLKNITRLPVVIDGRLQFQASIWAHGRRGGSQISLLREGPLS